MNTHKTSTTLTVLMTLLLTAGISQAKNNAAVVTTGAIGTSQSVKIGDKVQDFPIVSKNDEQYSFNEIRHSLTILAFVETDKGSKLQALANEFKNSDVAVMQISSTSVEQGESSHLVTLTDPQQVAWKLYKQPAADTVFLVNHRGIVKSIESLANLDRLAQKAKRMNSHAEQIKAFFELGD